VAQVLPSATTKDTTFIFVQKQAARNGQGRKVEILLQFFTHEFFDADEVDPKKETCSELRRLRRGRPARISPTLGERMAEDARSNTYHLFKEEFEDLSVNEESDHVIRCRRLADEYKGM